MKNARGFTIVEIFVVLTIMSILVALAARSWNQMATKSAIEGQIKTVYADLMNARMEALYTKRERSVVISGKTFRAYSSTVTTVSPIVSKTFTYNFRPTGTTTITFDTSGMSNGTQGSVCVDPHGSLLEGNDATVDSLVVSQARINLGKRAAGANCDTSADSNIVQK
jgi:prepilin-type N-terminal cleavage/methylation domain-containing protein